MLGIAGLVILFSGKTRSRLRAGDLGCGRIRRRFDLLFARLGALASAARSGDADRLTAAQGLVAAIGLSLLSFALEPVSPATFRALATPLPLAGLLFMVFFGTFIAYTIFSGWCATGARRAPACSRSCRRWWH